MVCLSRLRQGEAGSQRAGSGGLSAGFIRPGGFQISLLLLYGCILHPISDVGSFNCISSIVSAFSCFYTSGVGMLYCCFISGKGASCCLPLSSKGAPSFFSISHVSTPVCFSIACVGASYCSTLSRIVASLCASISARLHRLARAALQPGWLQGQRGAHRARIWQRHPGAHQSCG